MGRAPRPGLGNAGGAGRVVEGVKAAVVEKQDAVGDVADVGELVGRDDDCLMPVVLTDCQWLPGFAAREQGIVDEQESVGARRSLVQMSRFDE